MPKVSSKAAPAPPVCWIPGKGWIEGADQSLPRKALVIPI
jgi:hypothetical protein